MINLKPLKEEAGSFPEPLKSLIELSKDYVDEADFLETFLSWRRAAKEIDIHKKSDTK